MIVTVTPNAAVDVTYRVADLVPGQAHRVRSVHSRAGGKGVNVARVLARLGEPVLACLLAGGRTGDELLDGLRDSALPHDAVAIADSTRRTLSVVDDHGTATLLNEPGPAVTAAEWAALRARVTALAAGAAVVVVSGSLPPGAPEDAAGQLVAAGAGQGARVVLDTSGAQLRAACAAGPEVVKPNAEELREATGEPDVRRGADLLRAAGARTVVVSSGPDGVLSVAPEGCWAARPGGQLRGNPTGAGDALVAGLARGLAAGEPWPEVLRSAVAVSAAAVLAPLAGDVQPADVERLARGVRVERLP